ncbi:hypothetical protein Ais01nite_73050 [Asanoa ishikariensis]|nr:hypothetical protein Ais01nite_73050 [Asanoa ishikariensis]
MQGWVGDRGEADHRDGDLDHGDQGDEHATAPGTPEVGGPHRGGHDQEGQPIEYGVQERVVDVVVCERLSRAGDQQNGCGECGDGGGATRGGPPTVTMSTL